MSSLINAAWEGNMKRVKALVEKGADVNAKDRDGWTPLLRAAFRGHVEVVRFLVEKGADVNAATPNGFTPLLGAAFWGHLEMVRFLVEKGADVNAKDRDGFTPLLRATFRGHLEVVRFFVEKGADVNAKDRGRDTPLLGAAREGHLETVQYLVEKGADVNAANPNGDTPLLGAAFWGHLKMVQYLMEKGADVNAKDRGRDTPLLAAARDGHLEVVQYLVEKGADVNAEDRGGDTPLLGAACEGHLEVVHYLVEKGADVNAANPNGDTPLLRAARDGHLEMVQYLMEKGADVNAKDRGGDTPLLGAAREGHLQVVRHLVDMSADVNAKDNNEDTPLIRAAREGHLKLVRCLVENGADVNAKNVNGITALDVSSSLAVVQFLVNLDDESMQRDWLIPEDQIERFQQEGKCQLVDEWLGANVFIRPVKSRKQLSKETKIWHRLYHPHIALMFGACYIHDSPFIVCEYAPNGQLLAYLEAHPKEVWRKLYEAALGLSFLHRMRVVHGDLKCSNILIGSDGFAKLTNFSSSSLESLDDQDKDNKNMNNKGTFRRLVGGVSKRDSAYESDLHSFGVCIIDAVSGKMFKRRRLLAGVGLPLYRPQQFTDAQWNLVKRLCRSKTKHDFSAIDLVQELRIFADEAKGEETKDDTVDTLHIKNMLEQLEARCNDTNDADKLSRHVYERLEDVYKQLGSQSTFLSRYSSMTKSFLRHITARPSSSSFSMIVVNYAMSRQVANDASFFHHKIDRFMTAATLSMSADIHKWRSDWDLVRKEQNHRFMNKAQDEHTLLEDIPKEEHEEVLTNLRFQLSKNYTNYETSVSENLTRARTVISTLCKDKGILYDSWFIPVSDVAFDERDAFARGGFGAVHHGKWLDSRVVIKTVDLNAEHNSQDLFLKEVKVWRRLYHPNIVQMYGACHVGKPFIVCAFAPEGQLDEYLEKHPCEVWGKLYEAALGLRYLHYMRVIHGDLKCNNILIGADGRAKLTDFGLSSIEALSEPKNNESDGKHGIGAVRWKAPEVLKGGRATFQSDLYSFGMCVIEAVSGNYPWGNVDNDHVVTYWVKKRSIPTRPDRFTDAQWGLVEGLCKYEPIDRLSIADAVRQLKDFAAVYLRWWR